jgi:hypothetical protein
VTKAIYQRLIDEACQAICNPALAERSVRIDSIERHVYPSLYDADATIFKVKRCRSFIRQARCGEFDYTPDGHLISEVFQQQIGFQEPLLPNEALKSVERFIPPLWCLIVDMDGGMHQVTAVFRGDAFFPVCEFEGQTLANVKSPEQLRSIVAMMTDRKGFDDESYKRYCDALSNECALRAIAEANQTKTKRVN